MCAQRRKGNASEASMQRRVKRHCASDTTDIYCASIHHTQSVYKREQGLRCPRVARYVLTQTKNTLQRAGTFACAILKVVVTGRFFGDEDHTNKAVHTHRNGCGTQPSCGREKYKKIHFFLTLLFDWIVHTPATPFRQNKPGDLCIKTATTQSPNEAVNGKYTILFVTSEAVTGRNSGVYIFTLLRNMANVFFLLFVFFRKRLQIAWRSLGS